MYDPEHPDVPRQDVLGRLRRERWFAADAGEAGRVAQIDAQIERLTAASSPVSPRRETTSSTAPRRATTSRKK